MCPAKSHKTAHQWRGEGTKHLCILHVSICVASLSSFKSSSFAFCFLAGDNLTGGFYFTKAAVCVCTGESEHSLLKMKKKRVFHGGISLLKGKRLLQGQIERLSVWTDLSSVSASALLPYACLVSAHGRQHIVIHEPVYLCTCLSVPSFSPCFLLSLSIPSHSICSVCQKSVFFVSLQLKESRKGSAHFHCTVESSCSYPEGHQISFHHFLFT